MAITRNHLLVSAIVAAAGCASQVSTRPAASPPKVAAAAPVAALAPGPSSTSAAIDEMLRAEWKRVGVVPSAPVDDDGFLRRAYLDVVGVVPPPEAVVAYERDASRDKRARLVASLVASPRYAEHWAMYWDDVLMKDEREARIDRAAFRAWLRDEIASNAGWDKVVYALVSATGQNSEGGSLRQQDYGFGTPDTKMDDASEDVADDTDLAVNPAVNFPLRYVDTPQDFAGAASRTFLGVQIQCAQCHDHKTEKWKQTDFQRFAAAFSHTQIKAIDKGNTMGRVRRLEIREIDRVPARFQKNADLAPIVRASPKALDDTDLANGRGARAAVAAWMTSRSNAWFAEAMVNRMWAHFLGRGFVDPIDDLRPSNPPAAPEALDRLSTDFVAHGFDVRWLVQTITATEAYALSSTPSPTSATAAEAEHRLWARFRMKPMPPDELLDSVIAAAGLEQAILHTNIDRDRVRSQLAKQYAFLFDVDEEFDHDAYEGTISQALTMLNGSVTGSGASALPGGALDEILSANTSDAAKIDALYLRTLSRHPSAAEATFWLQYVTEGSGGARPAAPGKPGAGGGDPLYRLELRDASTVRAPRARAYEDLLWALLNSSEFVLDH